MCCEFGELTFPLLVIFFAGSVFSDVDSYQATP